MFAFCKKHYILTTRLILFSILIVSLAFFRPIEVKGISMQPTLYDGQFLILNTLDKDVEIGDIVVVEPLVCAGGTYIIKRVTNIEDNKVFVEGDNKDHSLDSRTFGWIRKDAIMGVIIQ